MMRVSVVIPAKNAGPIFADVLDAVARQETSFPVAVIVVDSGSSDGTLEEAQRRKNVRTIEIAPEAFGHGRTRNYAVSQSDGDLIAFLTHDAVPVGTGWLSALVAAVTQSDDIAGAFGRHIAHDDASPFTKRDLELHFANFSNYPAVLSKDTDPARYASDTGWRQLLHYYSDNNSCLRRSVWEQIPYPDVAFAEDQIWADKIIAAGYSKAYAADAVVKHSHDYTPVAQLRRAFDEANAFRELFGYRLAAEPLAMMRSFAGLTLRDIRFARQANLPARRVLAQVARNGSLVAGHFVGAHGHRLPAKVGSWLSHDKRLFNDLRRTAGIGSR